MLFPSETAMAGIFPFEMPRLASFTASSASIFDRGIVAFGGAQLHRISFERASTGTNPITKSPNTSVMDFYFDPTSHLLKASAVSVPIDRVHSAKVLLVVVYDDYRRVGDCMMPFRFTETMEGQPYRMLQLSDVQPNVALDSTQFEF